MSPQDKYLTLIVLGSGGHTAEMCIINQALIRSNMEGEQLYEPLYLVAKTDVTSRPKLTAAMQQMGVAIDESRFIKVPRSREVGQSWATTIFTALWALIWSFWLVWHVRPRLVLCNGPGTCVPFCVAAYVWRALYRLSPQTRIVFVESFCRVQTLSLSGHIMLPLADLCVVQWPALAERYKQRRNVKYFGRLM